MGNIRSVSCAAAAAGIGAILYFARPFAAEVRPDPVATPPAAAPAAAFEPPPLSSDVRRGLDWLRGAQQADGGFGAGSHARQDIRSAHQVPTDPATTAVVALALLRCGARPGCGDLGTALQRAIDYLLRAVEAAPAEGPQITALRGTQPQAKMGQNVDTALAAQLFARLLHELDRQDPERLRVDRALFICLRKIEASQAEDGSWTASGWAPVLQTAQMCTALELAAQAGASIDAGKLEQARLWQRGQAAPGSGGAPFRMRTDTAAGIELYGVAANMRNLATDVSAAETLVALAVQQGKLQPGTAVDQEALERIGVDKQRAAALASSLGISKFTNARAFDEQVLEGFGNNGGEEFLSYQMKAEAMVIAGGEEWPRWRDQIQQRLAKVQNQDGSWTGHHCITSPTFCTAAAISCLTAERDVLWLRKGTQLATK